MTTNQLNMPRTLEEQRREFAQRRGLAMPLAGAVAWTIVGVAGVFLTPILEVWLLFGAVGSIAGLGMFLSRFTIAVEHDAESDKVPRISKGTDGRALI
jgi:hypothetical protein